MKIQLLFAASYGASPIHLHKRPSNEHSQPSAYQQLLSMRLNLLVVSFVFHHVVEATLLDDESDLPFPSTNHLGYQAFHLFSFKCIFNSLFSNSKASLSALNLATSSRCSSLLSTGVVRGNDGT